MDLKQLRTFRAVAELGSLSKAADRLRAAQPALSRHIKLLEHELRVELFVRNGRGMLLTSAGRMLLDRTTGLIRQIEQVSEDLKSANGNPSGRVILGLVPTVSAVLSGRFARRVLDEFPDISLRIVESYGGHLVEWLHRGEMDLAIIYGPAVDLHLSVQSIGREDIAVVGPPGSGLNKRKQVDLKWLVKQKLILPSISHGLRALLEKAAARERLKLTPLIEADSYRAQISLMEQGLGYTLLPPSAIRAEVAAKRLEMAALVSPSVSRELILASPIAHPASIATTTIATLIMSEIQQLSKEGLWKINMTARASRKGATYCTVAPDISTSRRHLTSSLSMKALNSAGVLPTGSLPCSASFAFTSGERSASMVARLIRSMISGGVFAGASNPFHNATS